MPGQDEQDYQDYQDYLAYQQHIAKSAPPEEPGLRGGSVRGIMDLVRPGFSDGQVAGAVDAGTLGNVKVKNNAVDPAGYAMGKYGTMGAMGAGTGSAVAAAPTALGRIGAQAGASGVQGFLQKPEGEDSLGARAEHAGVSAVLGGLFQTGGEGLSWLLGKGAKIVKNIRDVNSGQMANRAASAIDEAAAGIDKNQIAPRDEQLRDLLQGKEFSVNPDRVKPVFPRLGQAMEENLPQQTVPKTFSNEAGTFTAPVEEATESQASMSGSRALRLKRAADSAAQWGGSKPFDPSATAKGEDAEALANILRKQMNADPAVEQVNNEMAENLNLKKALLSREGTSPIETLTAKPGTSRGSIVDLADNAAGSNLRGLGHEIETARGLVVDPAKLSPLHPLTAAKEVGRMGARGAVEATSLADALRQKIPLTKEQIINMRMLNGASNGQP